MAIKMDIRKAAQNWNIWSILLIVGSVSDKVYLVITAQTTDTALCLPFSHFGA